MAVRAELEAAPVELSVPVALPSGPVAPCRPRGGIGPGRLPPELAGLTWAETVAEGLSVGLVVERDRGRLLGSAVLAIRGPGRFALAEEADQAGQIAAWAQVLASLGEGDKISRLVWVERADPEHLAP
ncbi:MAG: hypothetical protein ACRDZQ_14440, partial [Acidimicrobiales bacterium]